MSLRATQKNVTRSLLLESALALFQNKGYSATTIDDIAVGAGANRTTFYLHFSSKTQLMAALIEQINDQVISSDRPRLTQIVEAGGREEIRTWLTRRFDQWPTLMPYVTAAQQAGSTDPEIKDAAKKWIDSAIDEIHQGLDLAKRFAPASRRPRALAAFGQVEFLSRRWSDEGWRSDSERAQTLDILTDSWCHLLTECS